MFVNDLRNISKANSYCKAVLLLRRPNSSACPQALSSSSCCVVDLIRPSIWIIEAIDNNASFNLSAKEFDLLWVRIGEYELLVLFRSLT